jgi:HK97 gp10 family phage protein
LPELKRKLERLKETTAPQVALAMEGAADVIVSSMRRLVPVDQGDLKDSIGWTWGEAPKGSIKVAQSKSGRLILTIYAGDEKAFYARWIEFGTAPHAQGGSHPGTQHPGTPPQPFFYPSYRANKKRVKKEISAAIRNAVKAVT